MTGIGKRPDDVTVTVLICVRDGAEYIREAIDSVHRQTVLPQQLLVADDGSVDDTARVAADAGAEVIRFPRRGLAAIRNSGFAHAAASHVAVLDADDYFLPHALERLTAAAADDPEAAGICGLRQSFASHSARDFAGHGPGDLIGGPVASPLVAGALWRRSTALTLPFDESMLAPDVDWVARHREGGHRIVQLDDVVLMRREHDSNTSRSVELTTNYLAVARAAIQRRRERTA